MFKAKLSFLTALGGLIFLIVFELYKTINSQHAKAFVGLLYEYTLPLVIGFIVLGIVGAIVQKRITKNMSPERRVVAETRFKYASLVFGSMGCGALFILGIERDNIVFFVWPLIIIVQEVGTILYAKWDAFLDRQA